MSVAKIIELVGTSTESFEHAIQTALETASQSIRHIHGVDVRNMTCDVEDGKITAYKVDLKVAFRYEE
ncbi:MAG: Dodecin [Candidatus Thorarchaeota archaeon]|nr:MAG: Dodecin [Candidatus Thorarchaeota archaeon]